MKFNVISRTLSKIARGGSSVAINSSGVITVTSTGQALMNGISGPENLLLNGDFRCVQRGTSFTSTSNPANNDDTYLIDRWIHIGDGNDSADISQETTTVPTGAFAAYKIDIETVDKQSGVVQVLEARDSAEIIGGTCSLSFKARVTGSSIANIRAAILSWTGTADTVTSDVVGTWAGNGTEPTWAANWTREGITSQLAMTTSYQTLTLENVSIDTASTKNVAVVIWIDDSGASSLTVGDFLYIADVNLVPGSVATPINRVPYAVSMKRCHRYYEQWDFAGTTASVGLGQAYAATNAFVAVRYDEKRTAPALTRSSTVGNFKLLRADAAASFAASAITLSSPSADNAYLDVTCATGLVAGNASLFFMSASGDFIGFDAEL